jgi:lysophospholipase L1-like esterase
MKKLFSGILSLAIALLVLELFARVTMTVRVDQLENEGKEEPWFIYSSELGWERKPGFHGTYAGIPRRFDDEGFLFGDGEKLSDKRSRKILFLGDSNTFGNDSPIEKSFPSLIDSALADAVTINMASPGYSSYQGRIVFQRALKRFRPDVLFVSFNFNDRRYVLREEDVDGETMFQRTYEQARWQARLDVLRRSYVFRILYSALRHAGLIETDVARPVMLNRLPARVSPETYRRNLTEISAIARREQIPVVFLLLRDNPRETIYLNQGVTRRSSRRWRNSIRELLMSK